ncbi:MAG: metallohydrolase [Bacilli bacterium]|nr:metallohydrolase [Bacilli bacterium]
MRFSVLASGSSGNSTYVETDDAKILIDAGVTLKQITAAFEEIAVSAGALDAILITHEHSDHIRGLGAVARKWKTPIYATELTWLELEKQIGEILPEQRRYLDKEAGIQFGSLQVKPFEISHDCTDPVGFCFYEGSTKLTLATDLGYVSQRIMDTIQDSDAYILETNHDPEMVRVGRYPWHLKRRVLGDKGHLSNETAADALLEVMTKYTKHVYMAHQSKENNFPELAELTLNGKLKNSGIHVGEDIALNQTYRSRPTPLQNIQRG